MFKGISRNAKARHDTVAFSVGANGPNLLIHLDNYPTLGPGGRYCASTYAHFNHICNYLR